MAESRAARAPPWHNQAGNPQRKWPFGMPLSAASGHGMPAATTPSIKLRPSRNSEVKLVRTSGSTTMPVASAVASARRAATLFDRDDLEAELHPGAGLRQPPEVGTDHGCDLRIAAGRLAIGHQNDRAAVARHLDRPHGNTVGDDVVAADMGERRTVDEEGHAVGPGRDAPRAIAEGRDLVRGEIIILRSEHHADDARRTVEPGRR